jgi:hypothetical protein
VAEPANGIGRSARVLEQLTDLLRDALHFLVGWIFGTNSFWFWREHNAGKRIPPAEHISTDLMSAAGKATHVVESCTWVKQALVTQAIDLEFALKEGAQLQEQRFAVERLSQEFPGASPVRFQPLRTAGGS